MSYTVSQRACYFRLGEQLLAFGSEHLRQIVTVGSLTRVPRVGSELLGLFSVGGAILPLIDLRPLLGLPAPPLQMTKIAALIEYEGHQVAFHLDVMFGFFPYKKALGQPEKSVLDTFSTETAVYQDLQAAVIDVSKVMKTLEARLVPV